MSEILKELAELVSFRLGAMGKVPKKNEKDEVVYVEANIFQPEDIQHALVLSLRAFNMIEVVTYFKFDDVENITQISDLLVTYASYLLLMQQSLKEKGREFILNDNGVSYAPPALSDFLYMTSRDLYHDWYQRVQDLKKSSGFYYDFVKDPDEEVPAPGGKVVHHF
jgi:hypothetical protein